VAAVRAHAAGAAEAEAEPPAVNDGFITSDALQGGGEAGPEGRLASAVASEILRARLEYIGQRDDATAPSFVAGWAADRDLTDPQRKSLEFSVFLTRNQISALAQSVALLVDAFRSGGSAPGAFFDELQLIAAKTARDPERVRADETEAIREILPAFLQGLPYLSEVLRLDRPLWDSFSTADRENFVEGLEEKLTIYRRLYDQTENWVDFGAGDPALEAYPLPLAQLP
jgi:serine/threonine-protein kinase PpkA